MEPRTQLTDPVELAIKLSSLMVSNPKHLRAKLVGNNLTIAGASCDMGILMGKLGRNCQALGHLIRLHFPDVMLYIGTTPTAVVIRQDIGQRTDWAPDEEVNLMKLIRQTAEILSKGDVTVSPRQRVGVSQFVVSGMNQDDINALHTIFRSYGKIRGRNVEITNREGDSV